ncbi:hypothetical protein D3C73_1281280 [compost metagenome]
MDIIGDFKMKIFIFFRMVDRNLISVGNGIIVRATGAHQFNKYRQTFEEDKQQANKSYCNCGVIVAAAIYVKFKLTKCPVTIGKTCNVGEAV